ncbi:hypothetical protein SBFV3_gp26 [Sulfolobales Beppu filamentous virus 3]|uniref:Uncharacterized protein n=1 Tax=Sulfolobales Beppu filamentous virus 3 TaxID=2493124 RepID=A0A3Q8Q3U2_9VIRU|nr:hypothetical protein HOU83_gp26 [Sulfolobales Beppu filamentous virus 3]AZI75861.1 hypothetical protein SBFV3_gp26 [Sulfolobales Beppu filamentous virus 3]
MFIYTKEGFKYFYRERANMVLIVTFAGKIDKLPEVTEKNRVDIVFLDESFLLKNEKPITSSKEVDVLDAIKSRKVIINTGIKYGERSNNIIYGINDTEMINRRVRIAIMLSAISQLINSDPILSRDTSNNTPVIIFDSDVVIDSEKTLEQLISTVESGVSFSLCIPAVIKPFRYIDTFCKSTNMGLTPQKLLELQKVTGVYISNNKYMYTPVDIFINESLGLQQLIADGVCHYINNTKYCIKRSEYDISIKAYG